VVKEFLSRELGLDYTLRDLSVDAAAADEFLALGGRLPPLTVIGGQVIEGFNPEALIAAADALGQSTT
jgi:hypothetical protein